MSLTTIAMCWNHRSVLVLSGGYARPADVGELQQLDPLAAQPQQ